MKYILTRIIILILAVLAINYVSDYIGEEAHEDFGYMLATIWFYRFLFALAILSLSILSYEAYRFSKQNKIKERNRSFILISAIFLVGVILGGYFLEFVF